MGKAKKKKLVLFRHKFWTFVLRIIAQPLFCLLYKFKGQKFNLKKNGPHIILCNHTNNIDPILLSTTFNNTSFSSCLTILLQPLIHLFIMLHQNNCSIEAFYLNY